MKSHPIPARSCSCSRSRSRLSFLVVVLVFFDPLLLCISVSLIHCIPHLSSARSLIRSFARTGQWLVVSGHAHVFISRLSPPVLPYASFDGFIPIIQASKHEPELRKLDNSRVTCLASLPVLSPVSRILYLTTPYSLTPYFLPTRSSRLPSHHPPLTDCEMPDAQLPNCQTAY